MTHDDFLIRLKEYDVLPEHVRSLELQLEYEGLKVLLIRAGILQGQEDWDQILSIQRERFLREFQKELKKGIAWEDIEHQLG